MDFEALNALTYPKLQKLAVRAQVKATGKQVDIIHRLLGLQKEPNILRRSKRAVKPTPKSRAVKQETMEMAEQGVAIVATQGTFHFGLLKPTLMSQSQYLGPWRSTAKWYISAAHQGGRAARRRYPSLEPCSILIMVIMARIPPTGSEAS
ncbi:hypothetical protein B0H21DRAFT_885979 [Amylocystis lapponica]|nr:hypothetical protein B0H21DRAFT_885979 [Amylocystis lapponica]